MNIGNFINYNIGMLDNNTISVDHLANKLCVTLRDECGIDRTEKMEKYFREVFTKYKKKEIDSNTVIMYLSPAVEKNADYDALSAVLNNRSTISSSTSSSNNSKSSENITVDKQESSDITTSQSTEDNASSVTAENIVSKEIKEVKKIEIDPLMEKDVKKNISMLDNNTISVDNLTNKLSNDARSRGKTFSETDLNVLRDILSRYKKHEISSDDVVSYYAGLLGGTIIVNSTPTYQSKVNKSNEIVKKKSDAEMVAEIDTDTIMDASNELANVESSVESANLTIPSGVASYAQGMSEIVSQTKSEVANILDESKKTIIDTLNTNEEIDSEIKQPEISQINFHDIYKMAYDKKQNSPVVEADAEFFRKCGYSVDVNGNVSLSANGKSYVYNINSNTFTVNGNNSVKCKILVPRNAKDFSKMNTYTYFASTIASQNKKTYDTLINGKESNAIILQFIKNSTTSGGVQDINDGAKGKFIKQYEVSEATRFINAVAKTDLSSGKCRNIISGDSKYGAYSLIMAADYPDLYQTVYCVNNAAIVPGQYGINDGGKTHFDSLEQLKRLDGKDIFFISVSNEPNFFYNNGTNDTSFNNGYTYNGLKVICDNCPNANVHMVYNEGSNKDRNLIPALKSLEQTYSNYSYDGDKWNEFANDNYITHSQGQIITADLASANTTNVNYYTGVPRDTYMARKSN